MINEKHKPPSKVKVLTYDIEFHQKWHGRIYSSDALTMTQNVDRFFQSPICGKPANVAIKNDLSSNDLLKHYQSLIEITRSPTCKTPDLSAGESFWMALMKTGPTFGWLSGIYELLVHYESASVETLELWATVSSWVCLL